MASLVLIMATVVIILILPDKPTCFDGKMNQDEKGVDCGGPCAILCKNEMNDPEIKWVRVFKVKEGVWSVLAYVINHNVNAESPNAEYFFKVYDSNNVIIREGTGSVYIPANQAIGVFEPNILVGNRVPERVVLGFESTPWRRMAEQPKTVDLGEMRRYEDSLGAPRVSVKIKNPALNDVSGLYLLAVLYDDSGNAFGASKVKTDDIKGGEIKEVVFSWPLALGTRIDRVEILKWFEPGK